MTASRAPRLTRGQSDHRFARPRLVALLLVALVATGLAASAVSAAPALPSCKIADVYTAHRGYSDWARSILDPRLRLSSSYRPSDLRSTSTAGLNSGLSVRSFVIADLKAMAAAAKSAGARLSVQSAYRSYSTQVSTFSYWVRVSGYAAAVKSSARAGHSEHQLGTTLDFKSYGGSAAWNYADWGTSAAGRWLKTNAWKYGFVMSYPKGKTAVTCYAYEPWHYRYVGKTTAAAVKASGLTLREYLWRKQNTPTATPSPTPTPPPSATPTPTPSPTPTPTPTPIETPTPTPTPTPIETPTPQPPA
jgi:D-alanyl-D-alanine carboxypeptidase